VEAYHLSPTHPAEWLAQAAESAMQARDWQQAAQWYRTLTENERTPRKTRAGYDARLGFALASLARDQEALAAYDAAIQLGGATPALAPILPCPWGTPSRRHISRDPPSSFCGGRWPTRRR
jgi:hypothetical protein